MLSSLCMTLAVGTAIELVFINLRTPFTGCSWFELGSYLTVPKHVSQKLPILIILEVNIIPVGKELLLMLII